MPRPIALTACLLTGLALAAPAQADDMDMSMPSGHHHTSGFSFGAPAPEAQATRTIAITMNATTFTPAAVTVKPGETVRFLLTNTAGGDHEFVLGDTATQLAHRAAMPAMMHGAMSMEHDEPNGITVHRGETRAFTWTFAGAGTLEYDCNIPGHFEAGMHGVVTVK